MRIPLFKALYDIQNLSRLFDNISFTQTVHLQIKNNQLELPTHVTIDVTPASKITNEFLNRLDQMLRFYETTIYAITIIQGNVESIRRYEDGDDDLYLIGENDQSKTHYAMSLEVTNQQIRKQSLLPISRHVPKNYRPSISLLLEEAVEAFNAYLV